MSVEDRGFLFADAVYEAAPAYRGRCFLIERHLARLARGLRTLRIEADATPLGDVGDELMARNDLLDAEFSVFYMQVTRGTAPRTHAFPKAPVPPTVYAFAKELVRTTPERWERGFAAITVPDQRWARADIKTTGLLPNVLAQQAAVEAEVEDAIFIREGMVQEGTHNNVFAVIGGEVTTAPATNHILHGVTRAFALELCEELGIPARERAFTVDELRGGRGDLLHRDDDRGTPHGRTGWPDRRERPPGRDHPGAVGSLPAGRRPRLNTEVRPDDGSDV
ncbi:aminotransferase class IV [Candidatus Palauibacter sp.]|uniref:aminotransferase class IV n=1 Tax=Candidatus Palauibacter sp. TaxID=3101350 RepID=UPI003CC6DA0A